MFLKIVSDVLSTIYQIRIALNDRCVEETDRTELDKRETLLERQVFEHLRHRLSDSLFRLSIEGHAPVDGCADPKWHCFVDPLDGTSNTCRAISGGQRALVESFATVIAIAPIKENLTFGDFVLGAGLDLRSGQIWVAENKMGSFTSQPGESGMHQIKPVRHYHRHSPLLACEFFRHANWATRLLINQPLEWADTASSFMNILRVPLGETDCFFNNVVPSISNEGQRGHELGAILPFLRDVQGYAIDTRTGESLEKSPFTFDGMTPVIIGVDKETVDYYWAMIQQNLAKTVLMDGRFIPVDELISRLHRGLGTQRWSLRPLPK